MPFSGLRDYIEALDSRDQLHRIKEFVNPDLEITDVTDRITKSGGKALLFENTGTDFPVLINLYGSEDRMSLAIGREDLEEAGRDLEQIFKKTGGNNSGFLSKLKLLPTLRKMLVALPKKKRGKGACQQVIDLNPDLNKLPVLKCWPFDGGPFITLPVVHTRNPVTGEVNAGMYRMQVLDKSTTGMHWHRHKTGANHYNEYKKLGKRMPLTVTLGGDPVYTYSATAPLPEGVDEYMLAGFLRHKRVNMVKCITNDLWVPEDTDIVIEGYVDPEEELIWEGPFGDHTGFYSLADWYPRFHVTAITYRKGAVYPATIVGVPPQEDAVIGLATERLFLYPVKLAVQPDIVDFHMPPSGVAHNLVLVRINKTYPGQGMKVINALFGAGQMMFSKFIVVVDQDADLHDYTDIAKRVFENCDLTYDMLMQSGPLDVLDHSSDSFSFGGKLGIDATAKHKEEIRGTRTEVSLKVEDIDKLEKGRDLLLFPDMNITLLRSGIPIIFVSINKDLNWKDGVKSLVEGFPGLTLFLLDKSVDINNYYIISWQVLANTDPVRDIVQTGDSTVINSTAKAHPSDKFPRRWPNVVVSDNKTIKSIDQKWNKLNLGAFIPSPSVNLRELLFNGDAEVGS